MICFLISFDFIFVIYITNITTNQQLFGNFSTKMLEIFTKRSKSMITLEEIRLKYHDGIIPKKARSEIKSDFMTHFNYSTPQQYNMMLALGSLQVPTPNEFDWLSEKIVRYHDYYSPNKKGKQLELEKL